MPDQYRELASALGYRVHVPRRRRTQGRTVHYRLTQPELGPLLDAAGQLLTTAGQQATEENDKPVRRTQPTNR